MSFIISSENELVSIITPCYNASEFIGQTIESVLAQTYQNFEMIIIDDCSTDNSIDVISKYIRKDNRIKLIKLKNNSGSAVARNIGIKEAKGRYIAFLDSDDLWVPEKLIKQIAFMKTNELLVTYSSYFVIDKNGNITGVRKARESIKYEDMLKSNHIGNLTGIYDCKLLGKIYSEKVGHEDYTLWLKVMKIVGKTKGILEPLAMYRQLSNSLSANKIKACKWQWNIYRKFLGLNFVQSCYYLGWYIYYGLKKRGKI